MRGQVISPDTTTDRVMTTTSRVQEVGTTAERQPPATAGMMEIVPPSGTAVASPSR
jgi:hypothetical protein